MTRPFIRAATMCMLCGALLLFSACKKSLPLTPENVTITPVTTPTVYRYGPHPPSETNMSLTMRTQTELTVTEMILCTTCSAVDDRLIWHLFVPRGYHNGEYLAPPMPIVDITGDTDRRGRPGQMNITSPMLESLGKLLPAKSKAKFEKLAEETKDTIALLPEHGIVSGQILREKQLRKVPGLTYGRDTLQLVLDGECTKEGTTYVVASLNDDFTLTTPEDLEVFVSVKGYVFMEKESMETVASEIELFFRDPFGREVVSIKATITRTKP